MLLSGGCLHWKRVKCRQITRTTLQSIPDLQVYYSIIATCTRFDTFVILKLLCCGVALSSSALYSTKKLEKKLVMVIISGNEWAVRFSKCSLSCSMTYDNVRLNWTSTVPLFLREHSTVLFNISPVTRCIFSGNLSHNADSWSIAVASEEVLPYATQCFQFD